MTKLIYLIRRNCKLYFKDKGIFFTSLITPLILLGLYGTFLGNVYKQNFVSNFSNLVELSDKLVDSMVWGQLFSSLLAVSAVTVAFQSNMIMISDKVTNAKTDLNISPVKRYILSLSYFVSTAISTLLICIIATLACFIYMYANGWYMTANDIFYISLNIVIIVLFGTALSSIINFFLSTQGHMSVVSTIVSAGYGFICGAYMPISQFSESLRNAISFIPSVYGTSLLRNYSLRGVFEEMERIGIPTQAVDKFKDSIDCNLYFFGNKVPTENMYLIMIVSVIILTAIFILMSVFLTQKKK